jgi:hypothetical protein
LSLITRHYTASAFSCGNSLVKYHAIKETVMKIPEAIIDAPYHFQLSTGNLITSQACINAVEAERTPPNLQQLYTVGRLVVAHEITADSFTDNNSPPDTYELSSLIDSTDIVLTVRGFPHLQTEDWPDDYYLESGLWLATIMGEQRQPQPLKSRQIKRAYCLGIFASLARITSPYRFGTLPRFNRAFGTKPIYARNEYGQWPRKKFADYVEEVFLTKREDETLRDALWAKSNADEGPSPDVIARHVCADSRKNITILLNERGYSVGSQERQAYIDQAVRIKLVNHGMAITREEVIEPLQARRRAPSARCLEHYFGSVTSFDKVVDAEYNAKLGAIDQDIAMKVLPIALFENGLNDYDRVRRAAQYRVVRRLLFPLKNAHKEIIAKKHSVAEFMSIIRQHEPRIIEEKIQETARTLGVYDDIWTLEEAMQYLRID